MKKIVFLFIGTLLLSACNTSKKDLDAEVAVHFSHHWESTAITSADFNVLKFTNENGEMLSIEGLRYVVSNVILTNNNHEVYELSNYQLIDLGENQVAIQAVEIPTGTYTLSFIFGFTDSKNTDGIYPDLNSVSFNVPGMLGGGYHYMQFDGKYVGENVAPAPFNYHTIRAINRTDPANLILKDTSFNVNLGMISITNNTEIEIKMNIAEWFRNPNTWDLNQLNTVLMPNFEAQILMNQNGRTVFSLGEVY